MGRHSNRERLEGYFKGVPHNIQDESRARVGKVNAEARLTDKVERRRTSGTHQEDFKPQPFRQPQKFEVGSNGQLIYISDTNSSNL